MKRWNEGQVSTPENPLGSKTMLWVRDHLNYTEDSCLIWPFGRTNHGYAGVTRNGKFIYIHRMICERVNGAAPTIKHQVAHSCGNGQHGCLNPRHLRWAAASENQLERRKHGTQSLGRGVRKLTAEQVNEIKTRDQSATELAAKFNCSVANIKQIRKGLYWRTP